MLMYWRLVWRLLRVSLFLKSSVSENTRQTASVKDIKIYISDDQTGLSMFESDIRTGICNEILSQFVPRFEFATHQRPAKLTEKP